MALSTSLPAGSNMGARVGAFPWDKHPLGPPEGWSPTLRTAVGLCLSNEFPQLICWGPELRMIYNDAFVPILGEKPDALGRGVLDVFSEIADALRPMMAGVVSERKAVYAEDQMFPLVRHGFPEDCYFTFCYSPIPGEDGSVAGVLVTCTETTQRVVARRRLALLRELAERSASLTVVDAWAGAARAFESDPADLPAFLFFDHARAEPVARSANPLPPVADAPLRQLVDEARQGKTGELALPGAAGGAPIRSLLALPVGAAGSLGVILVGVSGRQVFDDAYRDLLRLAAEQIGTSLANARAGEADRRRAAELESLDRAKTAFFSNVSHEFRTPLTLQLGPLEALLARNDIPDDIRGSLEMIERNSRRLLKLVNTLLDFSRLESGRARARFVPSDLGALTAEAASAFASAMRTAGLGYEIDAEQAPGFHVDRDLWEKAILNLLSNAYKFTTSGKVVVRVRANETHCRVVVEDTGVGIDAEDLPHVFDRFHRSPNAAARSHEGTGIGLALVHEIARFHGGEIRAESEKGRGTRFTLTVPRGTGHLPPDQVAATPDPSAPAAADIAREVSSFIDATARRGRDATPAPAADARGTILVVDDNTDMRRHLSALLSRQWRTLEAIDGEDALQTLARTPVDLVLSDVMMPRRDGFDLLRAIRADPQLRHLPVIVLSARAGPDASIQGLAAGADDYVVKPFSAAELVARVSVNLELARMRRAEAERVASILESISDSFFAVDSDWRLTYLNRRGHETFCELAGPRESFIGLDLWSLFPPERSAPFYERYHEAMRTGRTIHVEGKYEPASRWFEVTAYPTGGGLSVFNRDVTARKESEIRLNALSRLSADAGLARTLQATYDAAFSAIETAMRAKRASILLFDESAVMRFMAAKGLSESYQRAVEGHTPWTPDSPDPTPIIIPDAAAEPSLASYGDLFVQENIASLAFFPLRHEGRLIGKFMAYHETPNAFGPDEIRAGSAIAGIIAIAITRRRAEEDAARARLALARNDKLSALGMLVSGVAHEIRTPLTIIETNTHVLETRLDKLAKANGQPPDILAALTEIRAGVQRANLLVSQLKRYTRLESNTRARININRACEEAIHLVESTRKAPLHVKTDLASTRPISADPAQIQQVVINLVTNALDATGGDASRVAVGTRDGPDGRVVLTVEDAGTGMNAATQARLFEPLFTTKPDGTGLGLSIVKRILDEHGATIECASEPGRGTRFTARFPGHDPTERTPRRA